MFETENVMEGRRRSGLICGELAVVACGCCSSYSALLSPFFLSSLPAPTHTSCHGQHFCLNPWNHQLCIFGSKPLCGFFSMKGGGENSLWRKRDSRRLRTWNRWDIIWSPIWTSRIAEEVYSECTPLKISQAAFRQLRLPRCVGVTQEAI